MRRIYLLWIAGLLCLAFQTSTAQTVMKRHVLGKTSQLRNQIKSQLTTKQQGKERLTLTVDITELKTLTLNVNVRNSDTESEYIIGEVSEHPESSFFLRLDGDVLNGNIILKQESKGYKYGSENGDAFVEEVDINELLCVNYASIPSNTTGGRLNATQAMPDFQSFPGARGCVLLDFDGHYVSGTPWNNGNPISAAPSGMSDAQIQETWEVVSEDFRPFHLNITTNEAVFNSYPKTMRMRCIITPTNTAAPGAGGVAYIGSFNWNDDTPCWVFVLGGKSSGEAASHEVGHTFGLGHDGRTNPNEGYFAGHGDWAPIMGVGYYENVTQWSRGEYNYANNTEDDLAKISSTTYNVGYRADDYGNSTGTATGISSGNVNRSGLIERTTDIDFFSFNSGSGTISLNVNTVGRHGDLNIIARIYNSAGGVIATANPAGLNAGNISANVSAGLYYLSVDNVGEGNPATDGYSDYGSLGSYFISGTIPAAVNGVATVYQDCNFGGGAISLPVGDYTMSQLAARGVPNDWISSVRVTNGYELVGYQDENFLGASITLRADDACLVDNNANDWITSLRVRAVCTPTAIVPYLSVNGGAWQQTASATLTEGGTITIGPQPLTGGSWSWTGPGGFTSTSREITRSNILVAQGGTYTARYTNSGGCQSSLNFNITVAPAGFTSTIQAENYSAMAGVQTEACSEGGLNVGWIENGDWMAYNSINIPTSGSYKIEYRVASGASGGQLSLDINAGATILGYANIPATGGWQAWATVSHTVNINAGTYNFGIFAQTGGWNINWWRITKVSATSMPVANVALEFQNSEIDLWPNPVIDKLNLRTDPYFIGGQLKVVNAVGAEAVSTSYEGVPIDVSHLNKGFYVAVINKAGRRVTIKFQKD
jgi:hypothetical protein